MAPGCLYVVATPIGNLEDISARAIRLLGEVDLIAAEDTRHTQRLLKHYDLDTPLTSYHEHNETAKAAELVRELEAGRSVALVADAGTPGISDPGYRLVRAARARNIPVVPVPGPSAIIAALSVSGLPTDKFAFHGFVPRKPALFEKLCAAVLGNGTHVFFESPRRLKETLRRLRNACPDAQAAVARELTKKFEQVLTGSPDELLQHIEANPVRGECVLIVHVGKPRGEPYPPPEDLRRRVEELVEQTGLSKREAVRVVAEQLGVKRNAVYAAAMRKK